MLMLCLSGLVAGASFGLFSRALALAIGMTVFSALATALVAIPEGWSLGSSLLGFAAVVTAFQAGFVLVAGLRFATTAARQASIAPGHPRRRIQ